MTGPRAATQEHHARIRALYASGVEAKVIALDEGLSRARVYQILGGIRGQREPRAQNTGLQIGGNSRKQGGTLSRFVGTAAHANQDGAKLDVRHPAMQEMRTLFPKSVVMAAATDRILISGVNSAKIGGEVRKGRWRGMPIFTVTLAERTTCPAACHLLAECYGNAMPFARRHHYDQAFVRRLGAELTIKSVEHPRGFVVRLHVLGDFPDSSYVARWGEWLYAMPELRVFGYTAHPCDSAIGRAIATLGMLFPARWAIRFSVPPGTPAERMQATTVWRAGISGRQPEGIVCPAQAHQTTACGTCALCWSSPAKRHRIVFIGHGMRGRTVAQPEARPT